MGSRVSRRTVLNKLAGLTAGALGTPTLLRAQSLKPEYKLSVVGNRLLGTTETAFRWAELVADNYAVERIEHTAGAQTTAFVPLHYHCLFKRGVPLGELWHLTDLARWLRSHHRTSFLLTAPPLRLPSAVGSPVTPVATV